MYPKDADRISNSVDSDWSSLIWVYTVCRRPWSDCSSRSDLGLHCLPRPDCPKTQEHYGIWATSWENLFMPYMNNKGADQPAHPCSLISTFVVCISSFCIGNFMTLASFFSWADRFESYLVENPDDRFSHDKAHIISSLWNWHRFNE